MFIKSIKLHNIRSYENAEINFPIGSVLLAGDIGSGKSTILIAIEFAIFGAKKGELPAYTLLRHGKKEGFVELRMQIDSKDIIIKRTLKRGNEDIKQETGYIIVNGMKKEGTSEELRAVSLELLGYPKDLIKKGKDLIYRYTVYTPQEEMKQILYESKDTRLDTLRKVFNIDKYKRVKDNSGIVIKALREKKRHLEGFVLDLDYKKKQLEERKNEISDIDKRILDILPKIGEVKKIIAEKKKSIEDIERDMLELNAMRKSLSIAETSLAHKIEQNNRLNAEIKRLNEQAEEAKKELEGKESEDVSIITKKISEKEKERSEADLSYNSSIKKIRELEVKMEHCKDTIRKISSMDVCPVCEQKVDESHKNETSLRENRKHEEFLENIKNYKEEEENIERIRIVLKKDTDHLVREQHHFNVLKIKLQNLKEKQGIIEEKLALKESIKKEIGILNAKKAELKPKIEQHSQSEEKYKSVRKEIDELLPQEKFLEIEKGKHESAKDSI